MVRFNCGNGSLPGYKFLSLAGMLLACNISQKHRRVLVHSLLMMNAYKRVKPGRQLSHVEQRHSANILYVVSERSHKLKHIITAPVLPCLRGIQ